MGSIIGLLVARGMSEKVARAVSYAGLLLLLLGAFAGLLAAYNHHVIAVHEAKIVARAAPATNQAASERASDVAAITQHQEEMHNAIAAAPDQPIAPTSHVRACEQLRRAGRHPPACR